MGAYHDSPNEEFVLQFFLNPGTGLSNWLTAHKKGFCWLASFSQYLKPQSSLRRPDPETGWSISKQRIYVFLGHQVWQEIIYKSKPNWIYIFQISVKIEDSKRLIFLLLFEERHFCRVSTHPSSCVGAQPEAGHVQDTKLRVPVYSLILWHFFQPWNFAQFPNVKCVL